jgi:hypothetical protein
VGKCGLDTRDSGYGPVAGSLDSKTRNFLNS